MITSKLLQVFFGMLWILLGPLVLRQSPNEESELSDDRPGDGSDRKCLKIVGVVEHSLIGGVKL